MQTTSQSHITKKQLFRTITEKQLFRTTNDTDRFEVQSQDYDDVFDFPVQFLTNNNVTIPKVRLGWK